MLAGFDCHCMQLRWCHHNILTCRNVEIEMSYFDSRSLLAAKFPWGFSPAAPVRDRVRRDDVLGLLGPQLSAHSAHSAHSALMNNYKPAQSMDVLKSCKIMQNQSTRKHDENMMKTWWKHVTWLHMAPYFCCHTQSHPAPWRWQPKCLTAYGPDQSSRADWGNS